VTRHDPTFDRLTVEIFGHLPFSETQAAYAAALGLENLARLEVERRREKDLEKVRRAAGFGAVS
jgi:hypothetical protein